MEQQTVHLFVFDTLADWEPSFAITAINKAEFAPHPERYRVRTVGLSRAPVVTTGGVTILPDMTLDELEPAQSAMLILPGGDMWDAGKNTEALMTALAKAEAFLAVGVPVAAICGATAGLARAGILDDKPHTSNALFYLQTTNYQGAAFYQDKPAVTADNVITASATASLEFAYEILKRLDVYNDQTLEAWYGVFKTGDPAYFFQLQQLAAESGAEM